MAEKDKLQHIDDLFSQVRDRRGLVLLEGPYSDHPDDAFLRKVLVDRGPEYTGRDRWVTWIRNEQTGGYGEGHYHYSLAEAAKDYDERFHFSHSEDKVKARETPRDKAIQALYKTVEELGLEASDLDELVHDTASNEGSNANNGGTDDQVIFLFTSFWDCREDHIDSAREGVQAELVKCMEIEKYKAAVVVKYKEIFGLAENDLEDMDDWAVSAWESGVMPEEAVRKNAAKYDLTPVDENL